MHTLYQIRDIVEQFGLVVISRCGSNPEQFIYQSDQLYPLKVTVCFVLLSFRLYRFWLKPIATDPSS